MSSELSDDAKELVNAGRAALGPAAADKARIAMALQARLQAPEVADDAAELPELAGGSVAKSPWLGKGLVWTGGVVISAAAAAYYLLPTSRTELRQSDGVVASRAQEATPAESAPTALPIVPKVVAVNADAAAPAQTAASSNGKTSQRSGSGDRLGEEAALLTRAEKAFHSGNFTRALALTNEHRAKFPKGLLTRERIHLRVEALCALGRNEEADKELRRGGAKTVKACGRTP